MTSKPSVTPRQHANTGPEMPQLPEPSHAERVRTLVSQATIATLSTCSRKHMGFPFGSLMPYALGTEGRPIFLISNMAMHTQNLKADPRASLFVAQTVVDGDALGAARATLIGQVKEVPENEAASAREIYVAKHENSRYWVDFADFSFFRLELVDVYYVGGFGVMGWVGAQDYSGASPDPLAPAASSILAHMNADHVDAMILLARTQVGIEATEASMTAVDRLGFHLRLRTAEGMKGTRINFPSEVRTPQETRKMLVEMVRQAEPSPSKPPFQ
jgi:putative heme iron utilization protein